MKLKIVFLGIEMKIPIHMQMKKTSLLNLFLKRKNVQRRVILSHKDLILDGGRKVLIRHWNHYQPSMEMRQEVVSMFHQMQMNWVFSTNL